MFSGTTASLTSPMEALSGPSDCLAASLSSDNQCTTAHPPSPSIDYEFDESQCLFCNQTSPDLDQNLVHMSKAHGLHVDQANLLVDVGPLLAYFHLVISGYHECLYCGTQRNTLQAVQQHMMAKGHCKYSTDKDAEFRDFYGFSSPDDQDLSTMRFLDDSQLPPWVRSRRPRPSKHSDRHGDMSQSLTTPTPQSHIEAWSSSNATETPPPSLASLSTRALKQEHTLNNQLSQLRADDRRSLLHLPASEQRALLATRHKQMEKASRTEQTNRGNLESAGNLFNCLGRVRLIRKPPHTGNVHSLNR